MAVGNFTWFDQALKKVADGTININGTSFKAVLCTSTQALSKTFSGSSTNCRYSDLTAELSTANGYTAGGVTLTSEALSRSGSTVKFTADPMTWTLTGSGVAFRYLVIYDDAATNKDLLCFLDIDTGASGNVTAAAGILQITPDTGGILTWSQP